MRGRKNILAIRIRRRVFFSSSSSACDCYFSLCILLFWCGVFAFTMQKSIQFNWLIQLKCRFSLKISLFRPHFAQISVWFTFNINSLFLVCCWKFDSFGRVARHSELDYYLWHSLTHLLIEILPTISRVIHTEYRTKFTIFSYCTHYSFFLVHSFVSAVRCFSWFVVWALM